MLTSDIVPNPTRRTMKLNYVLCVLLLLTGGCLFGDPGAARIVSLKLSTPIDQGNLIRSENDADVQQALKLIDSVLTSNGLTRATNSQTTNSDGTILRYESATARGCGVLLKNNKLEVAFMEFGRRSSTERVEKICVQLADELKRHYEAKAIVIRH